MPHGGVEIIDGRKLRGRNDPDEIKSETILLRMTDAQALIVRQTANLCIISPQEAIRRMIDFYRCHHANSNDSAPAGLRKPANTP